MRSVPCINQAFCNHYPRELSACTEVCAKNHCYNRTLGHWLHLVSKSKKPPNFELTSYTPPGLWLRLPASKSAILSLDTYPVAKC